MSITVDAKDAELFEANCLRSGRRNLYSLTISMNTGAHFSTDIGINPDGPAKIWMPFIGFLQEMVKEKEWHIKSRRMFGPNQNSNSHVWRLFLSTGSRLYQVIHRKGYLVFTKYPVM